MHAQAMEIEEELAIKQTVSEGVWVSIWLLTVTCHRRLQQNTCLNLVLIAVHLNILKPCKTFVSHGNDETPRLQGQPFAGAEFWAGPKATRFWWEPSQRNVRVKTVLHRVSTATSLWALVWADWLFLADSWASWLHRLHERSKLRGQSIQTIRLDFRKSDLWTANSLTITIHYTPGMPLANLLQSWPRMQARLTWFAWLDQTLWSNPRPSSCRCCGARPGLIDVYPVSIASKNVNERWTICFDLLIFVVWQPKLAYICEVNDATSTVVNKVKGFGIRTASFWKSQQFRHIEAPVVERVWESLVLCWRRWLK